MREQAHPEKNLRDLGFGYVLVGLSYGLIGGACWSIAGSAAACRHAPPQSFLSCCFIVTAVAYLAYHSGGSIKDDFLNEFSSTSVRESVLALSDFSV
jgi:hypothetical protein